MNNKLQIGDKLLLGLYYPREFFEYDDKLLFIIDNSEHLDFHYLHMEIFTYEMDNGSKAVFKDEMLDNVYLYKELGKRNSMQEMYILYSYLNGEKYYTYTTVAYDMIGFDKKYRRLNNLKVIGI